MKSKVQQLLDELTSRPSAEDEDGYVDTAKDKAQMLAIISKYIGIQGIGFQITREEVQGIVGKKDSIHEEMAEFLDGLQCIWFGSDNISVFLDDETFDPSNINIFQFCTQFMQMRDFLVFNRIKPRIGFISHTNEYNVQD